MTIICAWAMPCSGPGWSNQPVCYIVQDDCGNLTLEWLQPEEQTDEMHYLYAVSAAANQAMTRAVVAKKAAEAQPV